MTAEKMLFRIFEEAGEEIYLVGGRVRDRLLGRETGDLDFATGALPEVTIEILRGNGIRPIPLGVEFGTVSAILHEHGRPVEVQITTFRCRESYSQGSRHPSVVFGGTLTEDLARRDFTVNAIAMDSNGRVLDPLDGVADLRGGRIRTPLDPRITFGEDPLRMLRAYRFSCRLGFSLDPPLEEAVLALHEEILGISRERWKMEMDAILSAPDPVSVAGTLKALGRAGLLEDMIPELTGMLHPSAGPQGSAPRPGLWEHTLEVLSRTDGTDAGLRWAALLLGLDGSSGESPGDPAPAGPVSSNGRGESAVQAVCARFRFSRRERSRVVFLVLNHRHPLQYSPDWTDGTIRRLIREAGGELGPLLRLAAAEQGSGAGDGRLEALRERIAVLRDSAGRRLLPRELGKRLLSEAGAARGGEVGRILANLEEAVHRGELPPMAASRVYLDYLEAHPEIRRGGDTPLP